jgi:hypothetical protein
LLLALVYLLEVDGASYYYAFFEALVSLDVAVFEVVLPVFFFFVFLSSPFS